MTEFVQVRDALTPAERRAHYRALEHGDLHSIAPGLSVDAAEWSTLNPDERYRLVIAGALVRTSKPLAVSHGSAAALWRLQWLGAWPSIVHATSLTGRASSTSSVAMHQGPLSTHTRIDGLPVVGLARCVIDVAKSSNLDLAVVVADSALARQPDLGSALDEELQAVPLRRGSHRARAAVSLADGRSGSAGESVSRVTMERLGIPRPALQQTFPRNGGGRWFVDFWWPDYGVIGEFDGVGKYQRIAPSQGMSVADAVVAEKWREDELRALGPKVVRWGWAEARSPRLLGEKLRRAGLPTARASRHVNFSVPR